MTGELPAPFFPERRRSREVRVGCVGVGGDNPVRIQSMLTCDTMDTAACVRDTVALAEAGCEIVRITAPTVKDARNLEAIRNELKNVECGVPLVADIHPPERMESRRWKVRVNPALCGFKNSPSRNTRTQVAETAPETASRVLRARHATHQDEPRLLSDRIMNRYGDSPLEWWKRPGLARIAGSRLPRFHFSEGLNPKV